MISPVSYHESSSSHQLHGVSMKWSRDECNLPECITRECSCAQVGIKSRFYECNVFKAHYSTSTIIPLTALSWSVSAYCVNSPGRCSKQGLTCVHILGAITIRFAPLRLPQSPRPSNARGYRNSRAPRLPGLVASGCGRVVIFVLVVGASTRYLSQDGNRASIG